MLIRRGERKKEESFTLALQSVIASVENPQQYFFQPQPDSVVELRKEKTMEKEKSKISITDLSLNIDFLRIMLQLF